MCTSAGTSATSATSAGTSATSAISATRSGRRMLHGADLVAPEAIGWLMIGGAVGGDVAELREQPRHLPLVNRDA